VTPNAYRPFLALVPLALMPKIENKFARCPRQMQLVSSYPKDIASEMSILKYGFANWLRNFFKIKRKQLMDIASRQF